MRRLPSLTALRTFECAARHAHFGRAAAELCVTDSAVSHQVRQLEEQLGATLFVRRGRHMQPTPQARRLLHSLQQAFERVGEACEAIAAPDTQAALQVAVPAELAQKWLVGRLDDFCRRYPHIDLHLHARAYDVQSLDPDLDLAIIYGAGPADAHELFVRPLPALHFFPVCSPGLFNAGGLTRPADLARCRLLHDDQDGGTWAAWLATHAGDARAGRNLYFEHAGLALEAAANGLGVALGDALTASEDLARGRLVRPFAASVGSLGQYALVCDRQRLERSAVANFIDWCVERLETPEFHSRVAQ
ncbi:LysR substrate-binding domain-containing protein [Halomonas sp. THAF12]|uniref:LysR family glycine cleavage system transcriptional activator n=1 Tax=Halomonas organivorans TaxID=257772 RepID=A0A7W5BUW4_9GAMM|nr:LysR substrate-binding domain-containing protein [Halomonas organivorans]MBB3139570.1 LysR family glycine cleavage system transcriptional activator [Halomonas organivorans]